MHIVVRVPGSCGELVQGWDERPFLVTCPVNLYTQVVVSTGEMSRCGMGNKACLALERVLAFWGVSCFPYAMELTSELPAGKGMASSSADIAAVCFAAAAALGQHLKAAQAAAIAASIEPTDGVFFPGIVRMDYMTGELLESMGDFPELSILIFDTGGEIDTQRFHQQAGLVDLEKEKCQQTGQALKMLQSHTPAAIAAAATLSALANQLILPKPQMSELLAYVKEQGALGINTAHSGTVLGVFFAPDVQRGFLEKMAERIGQHFPAMQFLRAARLVSGGVQIEKR